ncbi:unnamed protein product [Penicillium palitans]
MPSLSGTRHPGATPLMPLRHSNIEALESSGFRAESQRHRDIIEGYDEFTDSLTLVMSLITTGSDEPDAVNVGPDEGTGFVGNIRRYFQLRHHRNRELASRHGGLDLVRQNVGFADRHAGLGFRQRIREFVSRLVDRYRHRRMLRRHGNALASHQARNNEHNIEDHDSTLRRFENLLAARQAERSRQGQGIEYHNSQHAHISAMIDLLQLPLPYNSQHAHGSDTDNSDDDLSSDRSSQR